MKKLKIIIKLFITLLRYPLLSIILLFSDCKKFYIGSRLYLNNLKDIKIGNNFYLGHDARLLFIKSYAKKIYNSRLVIGANVTIGNRFTVLCADFIEIQNNCLIASDVFITSENHGMNPEISDNYANQPLVSKPIVIEEGCWLGEKVCVLPGVRLGKRSIAATGSVITRSFPPYSLVGGVPAKLLKTYNLQTHKWEKV